MPLKWLLVSFKLLGYVMKPEKVAVQKNQDYGHCHLMNFNPF